MYSMLALANTLFFIFISQWVIVFNQANELFVSIGTGLFVC